MISRFLNRLTHLFLKTPHLRTAAQTILLSSALSLSASAAGTMSGILTDIEGKTYHITSMSADNVICGTTVPDDYFAKIPFSELKSYERIDERLCKVTKRDGSIVQIKNFEVGKKKYSWSFVFEYKEPGSDKTLNWRGINKGMLYQSIFFDDKIINNTSTRNTSAITKPTSTQNTSSSESTSKRKKR